MLWSAGAVLLGLEWWGDQARFWSSKPFVTNVFSSLTAALFGVPLALIVLQRLGVTQAEAVEARAARRLAAKVVRDLAPALHPGPSSDLLAAEAGLLKVERAAQEAIRQARQIVPAVAEVSAHWSFLGATVRSRLLETGGTWPAAPLAARINGIVQLLTADPYLDGWLRDLDMALRRFQADPAPVLRDLWTQLEIGYELAEAVGQLDDLTAEASRVIGATSG
ncbi:hypothetical protein ACIA5G_49405 [Amycolatopsis sp. NPDC051758]|uniref:hypothetical protein n=1 Tax=Amycolatopsis sp. NPDC051758 TaxID=3363935 RepID=UPI0037B4F666